MITDIYVPECDKQVRCYIIGYYYDLSHGPHESSKRIVYGKKNDESGYFIKDVIETCKQITKDTGKIDFSCAVPSSTGAYNPTILALQDKMKQQLGIDAKNVVVGAPRKKMTTCEDTHERRSAVAGKFSLLGGENIAGKVILLLDDVKTSGATITECSKTLLMAGVTEVVALCLAENY